MIVRFHQWETTHLAYSLGAAETQNVEELYSALKLLLFKREEAITSCSRNVLAPCPPCPIKPVGDSLAFQRLHHARPAPFKKTTYSGISRLRRLPWGWLP